jgi:membrane associated rhomboid family serine protease
MTLRTIAREIRDYPATAVFSASWIVVFVAMVALRMQEATAPTWWRFLVLGIGDGHRFGDLTLEELARGQVWRLVTCTFVHYSVIHIVLNLLAFYLLGTLVESWYGSSQLIMVYGITGGGGNLISALIRFALGSNPRIHAGGGSVVIMGLIGLCAVVGWRSRTERGSDLGWQMSKALGMTGLLGIAFPRYIDNWGHAGGAIVGFALGFFHRWFLRRYSGPGAWGAGVVTALVLVGCVLAQYRADRGEAPARRDLALRLELNARENAYRSLRAAMAMVDQQGDLRLLAPLVEVAAGVLDRGAGRDEYRRLRAQAATAAGRALTGPEREEFKSLAEHLANELRRELELGLREFRKERLKGAGPRTQRGESTGPLVRRTPSR